ncbi:MAG: methyltransferase domain-containing protein [Rhodospirillales bacterium]|nr:methyltransferase domain-containing protein [Rhodospirillales bacterium]
MTVNQASKPARDPAEVYDELFVPALFAQWGSRMAEAAAIESGQRVLDVGCGTGVLARAAAERVGPKGLVVGLDPNEQMLAVARRKSTGITWQVGRAEAVPFDDASFDAVVSQFALMFFESKPTAIAEMLRVLRPGGRLAIAVWDALERAPGYLALTELLLGLFGSTVAGAMHAPFALGDRRELLRLLAGTEAAGVEVSTQPGIVSFASADAMISTERACVWTLGGLLDEQQFALLRQRARDVLQPFIRSDGSVQFDCPAHIVTATRN